MGRVSIPGLHADEVAETHWGGRFGLRVWHQTVGILGILLGNLLGNLFFLRISHGISWDEIELLVLRWAIGIAPK